MSSPPTLSDVSSDDLRTVTLQRLQALGRMARVVVLIWKAVQAWIGDASLAMTAYNRALGAVQRIARAIRLIEALEGKLLQTLAILDAGVSVSEDSAKTATETDNVERPQRSEPFDRPDRDHFGLDIDALLKRPVDVIVARILKDLAIFPAWRDLAQAAWNGQRLDPAEAQAQVTAPIKAMRRKAPAPPTVSARTIAAPPQTLPRPAPA